MCSLILLPALCVPCRAGSSSVSRGDPTQIDHTMGYGKIKLEVNCPHVPGCKLQQFQEHPEDSSSMAGNTQGLIRQGTIISLVPG